MQKSGNAPGGANGIGKNAVLNVSDLRTVFYGTRYVNGKEGRVEKLQGKATLMGHTNPDDPEEDLQHVGFYSLDQGKPLLTTEIPDPFRLDDTGTGVFIIGFNPRTEEWPRVITSAVIQNYFYAIHHKKLVVKVKDQASETVVINHESIDWLFERESNANAEYHYYRTIRDRGPIATQPIGKIGSLSVYTSIGNGPRRTAYINRNGMLITDSREQKSNPIAPRGKSLWPDYTVVVIPETDRGDEWIRLTENPSHDSMSPRQCFEGKDLTEAERWFRQARSKISEIIDEAAQVQKYGDTSNLSEMAAMFPDEFDPETPGNKSLENQAQQHPNFLPHRQGAKGQGQHLDPPARAQDRGQVQDQGQDLIQDLPPDHSQVRTRGQIQAPTPGPDLAQDKADGREYLDRASYPPRQP